MEKNYCPFVKDSCRDDCVFKARSLAPVTGGVSSCRIAIGLDSINDRQDDSLAEIIGLLGKEEKLD